MQLDDTLVCIDIDLPGLRDRIADEGRLGRCLKQRTRTWVAERAAACRRPVSRLKRSRRFPRKSSRCSSALQPFAAGGGTNSLGFSAPVPKKNFSISSTRNLRAFGSIGDSRYSLMSMV